MPRTLNTTNKISYPQLQTEDYKLTMIQRNITQYANNISSLLSQKDMYECLATLDNAETYTLPIQVELSSAIDQYLTYDLNNGLFIAPKTGIFFFSFYTQATISSGTPTILFADLVGSENAVTATFIAPVISSIFYLNFSYSMFLEKDSQVTISLRADAAADVTLSNTTRLYATWR